MNDLSVYLAAVMEYTGSRVLTLPAELLEFARTRALVVAPGPTPGTVVIESRQHEYTPPTQGTLFTV